MKLRQLIKTYPVFFAITILALVVCGITFYFNWKVAACELAVMLVLSVLEVVSLRNAFRRTKRAVTELNKNMTASDNGNLNDFPLPIVIFDSTDRVLWYNVLFRNYVLANTQVASDRITEFTGGRSLLDISSEPVFDTEFQGRQYTVYFSRIEFSGSRAYALYFIDDTQLKSAQVKYELSKPVMSLIAIDSLEEIYHSYRESEAAEIVTDVERITEGWFSSFNGVFRKLGNGRFISIVTEGELTKMLEDKFSVLEKVRSYTYDDKVVGLTLSIGTGRGETINDAEVSANQALDMALGRGGDQVALKNPDDTYKFIGGVSTGVEKRTKVRSRVMASAIAELITNAENVLIMGHKFSDLDALGAAVGMLKISQDCGTDARIVINPKTSLATPLIEHLKENNMDGVLILPEFAEHMINERTLLIIVDTLRADFVESRKVYEKAKSVIVIDHHRKTVDYIQNAVIFYHEPKASSASEMVTELMQYTPRVKPTKAVANALLAGITLDTKNFVLRSSTRTFEAAAYLRSVGADTVTVKQFFNNSLENQKLRGQIVLSAYEHSNCAIAVADIDTKDIRLVSSQAADELLTINEVDASFVLFKTGDTVNISARSLGNINVQVIMEEFGGGGHQTMAACQIEDVDIDEARKLLEKKIDEYLEDNQPK